MRPLSLVKTMLGACLTAAFVLPDSLGIMSLLCLLPYARAQPDESTWLSLNGEYGIKYQFQSVTSHQDILFLSGNHGGYPNYKAIMAVIDNGSNHCMTISDTYKLLCPNYFSVICCF